MTDADTHHNQFLGLDIYEFFPLIQAPAKSNFESDEGTADSEIVIGGDVKTKKRPLHTSASTCVNFTLPPIQYDFSGCNAFKEAQDPELQIKYSFVEIIIRIFMRRFLRHVSLSSRPMTDRNIFPFRNHIPSMSLPLVTHALTRRNRRFGQS